MTDAEWFHSVLGWVYVFTLTYVWYKRKTTQELRPMIDGMCITSDGTANELVAQLTRLKGRAVGIKSSYIHNESVQWLAEAIDEKIAKEVADELTQGKRQ